MSCCRVPRTLPILAALAVPLGLWAQSNALLTVAPPERIVVKREAAAEAKLAVRLEPGYHVNSNAPKEDYLIPLRLRWDAGPLKPVEIVYPKPELRKYEFSDELVSVFTGDFNIIARFKPDAGAPGGPGVLVGRLRYQACNENTCFPPKTVEIRLPYSIQ